MRSWRPEKASSAPFSKDWSLGPDSMALTYFLNCSKLSTFITWWSSKVTLWWSRLDLGSLLHRTEDHSILRVFLRGSCSLVFYWWDSQLFKHENLLLIILTDQPTGITNTKWSSLQALSTIEFQHIGSRSIIFSQLKCLKRFKLLEKKLKLKGSLILLKRERHCL